MVNYDAIYVHTIQIVWLYGNRLTLLKWTDHRTIEANFGNMNINTMYFANVFLHKTVSHISIAYLMP